MKFQNAQSVLHALKEDAYHNNDDTLRAACDINVFFTVGIVGMGDSINIGSMRSDLPNVVGTWDEAYALNQEEIERVEEDIQNGECDPESIWEGEVFMVRIVDRDSQPYLELHEASEPSLIDIQKGCTGGDCTVLTMKDAMGN